MTEPRRGTALVVAYDFPPHGAIGTMRTLRLVRHLVQQGWHVTVVTGDPATYLPSTPVDTQLLARVPAGVRVVQVPAWRRRPAPAPKSPSGARSSESGTPRRPRTGAVAGLRNFVNTVTGIPDREVAWLVPAVRAGLRAARSVQPDVIYSSAPPWTGQLVAATLAARLRCPWVADFRDPWARAPWREDRPRWLVRVLTRLEALTVRRADAVIFTTASLRDDIAAAHDPAFRRKYFVVANGCDRDEFPPAATLPQGGRFTLVHAGSLYGRRDPRPLMEAIAACIAEGQIDRNAFRLQLIGSAVLEGESLAIARDRLGLADVVEVIPRMPRAQALEAMYCASALLLIQPGHPLSIPAKAYEYLAIGRPVFALVDEGETATLVRQSGAGIVVVPSDAGAMRDGLMQLLGSRTWRAAPSELFDGAIRAREAASVLARAGRLSDTEATARRVGQDAFEALGQPRVNASEGDHANV